MSALVPVDLVERIEREHSAANRDARSALEHAVRCGELLTEAKATVEHGAWLPWIEEHLSFGARQAQKYVRIFALRAELANANSNSHFAIDGVLAAFASSPEVEPGVSDEESNKLEDDDPAGPALAAINRSMPHDAGDWSERRRQRREAAHAPQVTSLTRHRRFLEGRANAIERLIALMDVTAGRYGREAVAAAQSAYASPDCLDTMCRDIGDVIQQYSAPQPPREQSEVIEIQLAHLRTAPPDRFASWLISQLTDDDLARLGPVLVELGRLLAERFPPLPFNGPTSNSPLIVQFATDRP
jgi:hypothetical protein